MPRRRTADNTRVSPLDDDPRPQGDHPLERAHRFFQRAAPAIRDAQEKIEQAGGVDGLRETVQRKADEIVQRVDEVVANATAIEGEVVDPAPDPAPAAAPAPVRVRARRRMHYVEIAVIAAAATFGALVFQRRLRG